MEQAAKTPDGEWANNERTHRQKKKNGHQTHGKTQLKPKTQTTHPHRKKKKKKKQKKEKENTTNHHHTNQAKIKTTARKQTKPLRHGSCMIL